MSLNDMSVMDSLESSEYNRPKVYSGGQRLAGKTEEMISFAMVSLQQASKIQLLSYTKVNENIYW